MLYKRIPDSGFRIGLPEICIFVSYAVDLNAVDHAFQRVGAPEGRLESVSLRKKRFEFPGVERLRSEQIQIDTHTMPQI